MSELKTKINDAISEHIDTGNSYTYQLIRTKEAFQYGTVTLDDFIEWDDDAVEELSNDIMKALQPKLNKNQEIVLEQMKASVQSNEKDIIQAVASIHIRCNLPKYYSKQPYKAYLQLTEKEEAQVLQVFATWALDQC
mgnify:CR=1 FL=1